MGRRNFDIFILTVPLTLFKKVLPMRSLSQEYFVLRTNAIQRKRFQTDQVYGNEDDSNVSLLRDEIELENGVNRGHLSSGPPSFVNQSEALQYQMTRVEDKVKQLHQSHKSHLARPTLDDVSQEEAEIQTQTKEVTEVILDATIIPFVANMNVTE